MTRDELVQKLGEKNYKKAVAYILSGNSPRDLCDSYLDLLLRVSPIEVFMTEIEEQEQEIFEGESDFVETFDTMQTYPDSIIWG